MLSIQWRLLPTQDTIVIVDSGEHVLSATSADAMLLSKMLTQPGDLRKWSNEKPLEAVDRDPETWGELVISRSEEGEILVMDPELFWNGVYEWFRSRGIDYDVYLRRSLS